MLRPTGLEAMREAPWGTHFCHFFETCDDLGEILVPFFRAGLQGGESCVWVTCEPLGVEAAWARLAEAVPDLEAHRRGGRLEILAHDAWYLSEGQLDATRVLAACGDRLAQALARGSPGLRLSGNFAWLQRSDWSAAVRYEAEADALIARSNILALCSYPLAGLTALEALEVVENHQFTLRRRDGAWVAVDASARRQLERAHADERERLLAEARERAAELDAVFAAIPDGIAVWDREARVRRSNAAARAVCGGDLAGLCLEELSEQLAVQELGRGPLDPREAPVVRALRGEQPGRATLVLKQVDGSELIVDASSSPLRVDGEVTGAVTVWHDVTRRRQMEERLRVSEQRLQALAQAVPQLVWMTDATGALDYANERWSAYTGLELEQLAGDGWVSAVHPDDRERVVERWRASVSTGAPFQTEYRMRSDEGDYRWFLARGFAVRGEQGGLDRWVGTSTDIDEIKLADEAVRLSGERHRSLFASMTEALAHHELILDAEGEPCDYRFLDVNPAFEQLTGLRREQVVGRLRSEVLPDEDPSWLEIYARVALTGEPVQFEDQSATLARTIEVRASRSAPGEVVVSFTDTSERSRMEQALRDADRHRSQFLAVLSHELRNPLTPIRNGLYVLGRAEPGSERAVKAHEIIDRQVRHLSSLIDDLLDVTRVTRGKVSLRRDSVELVELTRRTIEDFRAQFAQAGVELRAELPEAGLWVWGDPTRLAQVVANLLQNAAKFTPPGGETQVTLEASARRAKLRVKDTGHGIAADMLPRLFVPFMQADASLDRRLGGLGLGLSLIKGLVELHGGEVSAASAGPGQGSEFLVELPLAERGETPPRAFPAPGVGAARRILVIEDHRDVAESLRSVLELGGNEVKVSHTALTGFKAARRFRPHAVLCDIGLPKIDGYELARMVRRDPVLGPTFLVAVTGYALPADVDRALRAGFDRHLAKPVAPETLEAVLAQAPHGDPIED